MGIENLLIVGPIFFVAFEGGFFLSYQFWALAAVFYATETGKSGFFCGSLGECFGRCKINGGVIFFHGSTGFGNFVHVIIFFDVGMSRNPLQKYVGAL